MSRVSITITLLLLLQTLAGCSRDHADTSFNVWLQDGEGTEMMLGRVRGLERCRATARAAAEQRGLAEGEWRYHCCLRGEVSECSQRLR